MIHCSRCGAQISDWEVRDAEHLGVTPCWCDGLPGGVPETLSNLAYAELCHADIKQPVKTHDVIRFVTPHYNGNPRYSMNVALSQGKRFCWGGRSLYGLARHGLIPGARSLADAAYAALLAAPHQLHVEELDFVLEQMNYRFNTDSLLHHVRGYTGNRWGHQFQRDYFNRVWVKSGRDARHEFNACIRVCPTHAGFDRWIAEELAPKIEGALADRTKRLADLDGSTITIGGDRVEFD